jgi:hypothetical protein
MCTPNCIDKECGPDGCGGICGKCADPFFCNFGQCLLPPCIPSCAGKECADDGCGGSCGSCVDSLFCTKDTCAQGKCEFPIGQTYCVVDYECISQGTTDPDSPCRKCQPALSQTAYSPLEDGLPCGNGGTCQGGKCP